jgi:DNA-binding CsgD family transcriptional regulator
LKMKIGWLIFYKKKRKRSTARKRARRKNAHLQNSKQLAALRTDFDNLKGQFNTMNMLLQKHDEEITANSNLIEKHTKSIQTIEQMVANLPTNLVIPKAEPTNRPVSTTRQAWSPLVKTEFGEQKFNISQLSQQERKILSVFFQNKDLALSYADIARSLGKSPNTIKNQIRQINMRANLFNYTLDNENRKRFKLKDSLTIEKYLNIPH